MSTERPTHEEPDDGARDETAREAVGRQDRTGKDSAPAGAGHDGTGVAGTPGTDAAHATAPDGGERPGTASQETAETFRGGAGHHGAGPADPADTDTDTGRRRRRTPMAVASVALAVLLAGGGGAYLAATASGHHNGGTDGPEPSSHGNPPPLALDDLPQGAGTAGRAAGEAGVAPGEPDPNGSFRTLYRATEALPKGPSQAPAYHSTGSVTAEQVSRLAKALGVSGTPRLASGSWQVGPAKDGSGPSLQVTRQTPGTWTFARNAPGGDSCPRGKECAGGVVDGGSGPAVSERAAKAAAAPVLKALGQDDAHLDAGQLMGAVRVVNADPTVDGLPTFGWPTGIRVGSDGSVVGGSGRMVTVAKGGTYPVLDADRTLDLLNKSGYGRMMPKACPAAVPDTRQGSDDDQAPGGCAQQDRPRGRTTVVPVRSATFGLASHIVSGRPALVPSWFFEARPQGAEHGYTLTYPAVDPSYLKHGHEGGRGSQTPADPGDGKHVQITSYTADGRSLTVHFYGGVCSDYTVAADEGRDEVAVTVAQHDEHPGKNCIMIAKKITKTVALDEPLGDRKVVDSRGATIQHD